MPQKPISYEQILRELQAAGQMPAPIPTPAPTPVPNVMPQPIDTVSALIRKRQEIQEPFGQVGQYANPETVLQNQGQQTKPSGLLQLLMGLLK